MQNPGSGGGARGARGARPGYSIPGLPRGYRRIGPGGRVKPGYIYNPNRGWMPLSELASIYGQHAGNRNTPAAKLANKISQQAKAAGQKPTLLPKNNQARQAPRVNAAPVASSKPKHSANNPITRMLGAVLTGTSNAANSGGGGGGGGGGGSVGLPHAPKNVFIPASLANQGVHTISDLNKYADNIAGAQFDPQIYQAQIDAQRQPAQAAQDQHDIAHWYKQVMDHQAEAAVADKAAGHDATQSVGDAASQIVASLGGDANGAGSLVGAAGANATGTIGAMGAAEDMFNNDLKPILAESQAGAASSQRARDTAAAQDLAQQLIALRGQRGQAKANAYIQGQQANNDTNNSVLDRLMQIRQYNNTLRQQGFQNQMSIGDQQLSAQLSGARAYYYASGGAKSQKPAPGTFASMSAPQRAKIRDQFVNAVNSARQQGYNTPKAVNYLGNLVRSQGWSFMNPAVKQFAFNVLNLSGIQPMPGWYSH